MPCHLILRAREFFLMKIGDARLEGMTNNVHHHENIVFRGRRRRIVSRYKETRRTQSFSNERSFN